MGIERDVARRIRASIRADNGRLLLPKFRGQSSPYAGYCYIASEAFVHSMPRGYKPMFLRWEGAPHWFVLSPTGKVIDLTAEQFKTRPDYGKARGKGFLTKHPSRRARELLRTVL